MSLRLAVLLALLSGALLAALTLLDPAGVRVALAGGPHHDLLLMALFAGTFIVGAALGFVLGMLRDVGRSYRGRRREKRAQRADTLDLHALEAEERIETLIAAGNDCRTLGQADGAIKMYQRVLVRDPGHVAALCALRDVLAGHDRWTEALNAQERLIRLVPREDRDAEEGWLAGIQYEMGRVLLAAADAPGAADRFRDALRTRPDFLPAALALGDACLAAGDTREALRVWERALEKEPAPPLLARIGEAHRAAGRPARLLTLYRDTAGLHLENLAAAFGLGRAYFELAMLDEAAEQFQKLEVRVPDFAGIHAYLGAILERHGQAREAFEEYRRALRFPGGFEWPHRCAACGATRPSWFDRCPSCRRWNTARP